MSTPKAPSIDTASAKTAPSLQSARLSCWPGENCVNIRVGEHRIVMSLEVAQQHVNNILTCMELAKPLLMAATIDALKPVGPATAAIAVEKSMT